jgi:hypothetical protein
VQANLYQEVVLVEVHIHILKVPPKSKDLLLQVRGTNLQIHHLAKWDQLSRLVEINALCVEDVAIL